MSRERIAPRGGTFRAHRRGIEIMAIAQDQRIEQRIEELEQTIRTSEQRTKRWGYLIAATLVVSFVLAWMQMIRTDRLYEMLDTRDVRGAIPPLAAPASVSHRP